jgi:hypothetical protein
MGLTSPFGEVSPQIIPGEHWPGCYGVRSEVIGYTNFGFDWFRVPIFGTIASANVQTPGLGSATWPLS